jgi:hypothetical protein
MATGVLVKQWSGLVLAFLLTGCMSAGPAPGSVRNTAETAPADLQLACANAAAKSLGVDGSSILPVSSSKLDAQKYEVELNAKGMRASCVIDATGNVLSVQKT